jgi:hypothetical protein
LFEALSIPDGLTSLATLRVRMRYVPSPRQYSAVPVRPTHKSTNSAAHQLAIQHITKQHAHKWQKKHHATENNNNTNNDANENNNIAAPTTTKTTKTTRQTTNHNRENTQVNSVTVSTCSAPDRARCHQAEGLRAVDV